MPDTITCEHSNVVDSCTVSTVNIYRIFQALSCFRIEVWAEYVMCTWKVRNLYKVQPEILKQIYQ